MIIIKMLLFLKTLYSWVLNDKTLYWVPIKTPVEGKEYQWDEENKIGQKYRNDKFCKFS